ncbi:MAG: hypothetical protein JRJ15_09900, partial [Deltaproteobacteria bacterium]|nr:hypothetical protein [Deltaproteobacteria bacterium]
MNSSFRLFSVFFLHIFVFQYLAPLNLLHAANDEELDCIVVGYELSTKAFALPQKVEIFLRDPLYEDKDKNYDEIIEGAYRGEVSDQLKLSIMYFLGYGV